MTVHKTSLNITEHVFGSLQTACADAGTNLTEVCKLAGVNRSTVERWKAQEPKTLVELRKLYGTIEKLRRKRGK